MTDECRLERSYLHHAILGLRVHAVPGETVPDPVLPRVGRQLQVPVGTQVAGINTRLRQNTSRGRILVKILPCGR